MVGGDTLVERGCWVGDFMKLHLVGRGVSGLQTRWDKAGRLLSLMYVARSLSKNEKRQGVLEGWC